MEIEVLSVFEVSRMIKKLDKRIITGNWISIADSYDCSPLPDGENVLKVNFDDATTQDHPEMDLCNSDHAERIIEFAGRLPEPKLFIHCFAGVSRSGAVAKVLNIYLNLMLRINHQHFTAFIKKYDGVICPNPLVERLLWIQIGETLARKSSRFKNT